MNNLKKILLITIIFAICLLPQTAKAVTASGIVDKTINLTAKTAYYATKYTLKTGWFVTKKTAKGVKTLTKSTFRATRDAFKSDDNIKPVKYEKKDFDESQYYEELPPPPVIDKI